MITETTALNEWSVLELERLAEILLQNNSNDAIRLLAIVRDAIKDAEFKLECESGLGVPQHRGRYRAAKGREIDGTKDGEWRYFNDNGNIETITNYKKGVQDGPTFEYHENGKIWETYCYENGKREGAFRVYSDKGTLIETGYYLNDKLHGKFICYYESGEVELVGEFYEDKNIGIWKQYDKAGNVISETAY